MDTDDTWKTQTTALGALIRTQRALADLSLREMATMTNVSNAYLSQVERGLHEPSLRVLRAIADALHVPADQLLAQAGLLREQPAAGSDPDDPDAPPQPSGKGPGRAPSTEASILADPALSEEQRQALLGVYRSFVPQDE